MPRRPRPIRAWHWPEPAPAPTGQAAALNAQLDQQLVTQLGAVPLLVPILEELQLRDVVNRCCLSQGASAADLDPGRVTELLVLNRLLAPMPLVHVEAWAAQTVVPDLLDLEADQCNDDRLARTLDQLAPHLDQLWQDLIVQAVPAFDLDLSQLAYDITSVSFCGAYEEVADITFGYSRDHRPDRQQLELATTVTTDGGVPVDYHILAGNVADRTTPVANLQRLQKLLALLPARDPLAPRPLVVSDRAMLTEVAMAAYCRSQVDFLGPLDPSVGQGAVRRLLASVSVAELQAAPLAYRPQRAQDATDWESYQGVVRELVLPEVDGHPVERPLQAMVVWSPGKARLDAQLRATQLQRLEQALTDLAGKLGRRPYTTPTTVEKRVATLLRRHPARSFLEVQVQGGTPEVPLSIVWTRCETALAEAARLDGRYVLGTSAQGLDAEQMLARSKRRDVPEKRYALLKGPLDIRPVYLHKAERIQALVFCVMVSLLVFAVLELLARRTLTRLSGTALIEQFATLSVLVLIFRDHSRLQQLVGLAPPLATILEALGFPPAERYLSGHG